MTLDKAKEELPDFKWLRHTMCNNCTANDWYCPDDCVMLEQAKRIPFEKIQKAYARHDGELWKVARYIKQAKV